MSTARETLIHTYLETLSGIPSIDYPDAQFEPPEDGSLFLRVRYIGGTTERPFLDAGPHIEEIELQISCVAPSFRTQSQADDMATLIQSHFAADTTIVGTGETTRVKKKPHIWSGYNDPKRNRWIVPVSIYLKTLPS